MRFRESGLPSHGVRRHCQTDLRRQKNGCPIKSLNIKSQAISHLPHNDTYNLQEPGLRESREESHTLRRSKLLSCIQEQNVFAEPLCTPDCSKSEIMIYSWSMPMIVCPDSNSNLRNRRALFVTLSNDSIFSCGLVRSSDHTFPITYCYARAWVMFVTFSGTA